MCHYYIPHLMINTFNYFAQKQSRVVITNSRPRLPENELSVLL